jgi:glycine cleavage system H protein
VSELVHFAPTHEYIYPQDSDHILVGLDPVVAEKLDEIRYIEVTEVGEELSAGDTFATIGTSNGEVELAMPVGGTILSINDEVIERPQLLCNENFDVSWLLEVEATSPKELETFMSVATPSS